MLAIASLLAQIAKAIIESVIAIAKSPATYPAIGLAFCMGWVVSFDHQRHKLQAYKAEIQAAADRARNLADLRVAAANQARERAEKAVEDANADPAPAPKPIVKWVRKCDDKPSGSWLSGFPANLFKSGGSAKD